MSKKEKDKKKKLSLNRTAANIGFALQQVWESSHGYFIMYYLMTFIYAPLNFFSDSYLLRLIVNGVEKQTPTSTIVTYIVVIGILSILIQMITACYWNLVSPSQNARIGANIQKKLFHQAASVELACYENPEFYDRYVKAMDQAYNRVMQVMNTVNNLIWRVITLLCNSFLLFAIDPLLIVFGLFPLLLGFIRRWRARINKEHTEKRVPIERRVNYVTRTFYCNEYAKEMRIGGMYQRMYRELSLTFVEFKKLWNTYGLKCALARALQSLGLEVVTILGTMMYAVWRTVGDGSMSIGDCLIILNSIGTISYCLSSMVQTAAEFSEHALFLEDVRTFLDYQPRMQENEDAPQATGGDICLENVSFRYDGCDSDVLHDVSLHVKKGERIALVGQNGSGKTTLVKLLLRLYDPTSGRVVLDGRDIRDYRLSSYRSDFSCVFQDFKVFSLPVLENVILRRRREGDADLVKQALRDSGAYDKIITLDQGIETTLTREFDDNGANLSVGEQQKVSLARVFAENASCIILDEPSSALDPIAEHTMFENMMRAARGRSVIFISHRLSSAVDADRIYLMEDGRIVEVGTHHELMQKNGRYAEMFRFQAENYVGKEAACV